MLKVGLTGGLASGKTFVGHALRDLGCHLIEADELGHQVDQKAAQNRADAEKRASDLKQAEADLAKAEMELQKGPILSEIERLQVAMVKKRASRDAADSFFKS